MSGACESQWVGLAHLVWVSFALVGGFTFLAWFEDWLWFRARDRERAAGVGGPVEVDRDSDGELLIDWSPGKGRMLSMTLRSDGRLSYAFTWDGEQAHGTAQMPAGVAVAPACCGGTGPQDENCRGCHDFDKAAAGVKGTP